jgi:hypothetical protein
VLITGLKPKKLDGYELSCDIVNNSPLGISDVAVAIRMMVGQVEYQGVVETQHTAFARHAVPSGHTLSMRLTPTIRLGRATFDTSTDRGSGYSATLYWRNETGKQWSRTDGERAKPCKSRDFPSAAPSTRR